MSAPEIAEKIYAVVDLTWFTAQGKQVIDALVQNYLSFEVLKEDGELSNELPQELSYDVKDKVLAVFAEYLNACPVEKIVGEFVSDVEKCVERQAWANGIVNMQEAVNSVKERFAKASRSFANLAAEPVAEDDLLEKYNKAKENTLLERIQGNNINDIIEYRSALVDYVRVSCENMLYAKLQELYERVADNGLFAHLQSNFCHLAQVAQDVKSSIVDCEANKDWDKEYDHMVPTDFFARNVEDITPEQAFHMILLQMFAKNEEWMVANGLLVDGELKVYVGNQINMISACLFEEFVCYAV